MKNHKKTIMILLTVAVLLTAVFATGRYGWKLLGFRACQGGGIESVEVSKNTVKIKGFCPGSFPEGFCGYYAEERDGSLYVGFRFSTVFGFFETGDFDASIPVKGEIREVVLKKNIGNNHLDVRSRHHLKRHHLGSRHASRIRRIWCICQAGTQ